VGQGSCAWTEEHGDNLGIEGADPPFATRRSASRKSSTSKTRSLSEQPKFPPDKSSTECRRSTRWLSITIARSGIRAPRSRAARAPSLVGYWDHFPPTDPDMSFPFLHQSGVRWRVGFWDSRASQETSHHECRKAPAVLSIRLSARAGWALTATM
jgi:hypothetical protein